MQLFENFSFKKKKMVTRTIHQSGPNTIPGTDKPADLPAGGRAPDAPIVPDGMWEKCPACAQVLYAEELAHRFKVCPRCSYHFRLSARQRIAFTADELSFAEWDAGLRGGNPLDFPGYNEKLTAARNMSGIDDSILTGEATIDGHRCALCAMDGFFMMGSMGEAMGERLTRAIERATEKRLPLVVFTVSGGARMQEGLMSLMQMAKTSAAIARHAEAGLLYITVLTDPTTGGVTASFAMLGDILLSEPGALIGFAGRRVIEQTVKQVLPERFQRAEFLLEKGFLDKIVPRGEMAQTIARLLSLHGGGEGA